MVPLLRGRGGPAVANHQNAAEAEPVTQYAKHSVGVGSHIAGLPRPLNIAPGQGPPEKEAPCTISANRMISREPAANAREQVSTVGASMAARKALAFPAAEPASRQRAISAGIRLTTGTRLLRLLGSDRSSTRKIMKLCGQPLTGAFRSTSQTCCIGDCNMTFLIITVVAISALTQNGQVTHAPPQPQVLLFNSPGSCLAAQAAVQARSAGNFHVFADCVAQ
jgi:hypothetical protein